MCIYNGLRCVFVFPRIHMHALFKSTNTAVGRAHVKVFPTTNYKLDRAASEFPHAAYNGPRAPFPVVFSKRSRL